MIPHKELFALLSFAGFCHKCNSDTSVVWSHNLDEEIMVLCLNCLENFLFSGVYIGFLVDAREVTALIGTTIAVN